MSTLSSCENNQLFLYYPLGGSLHRLAYSKYQKDFQEKRNIFLVTFPKSYGNPMKIYNEYTSKVYKPSFHLTVP